MGRADERGCAEIDRRIAGLDAGEKVVM